MPGITSSIDIKSAMETRALPTITLWNRLEGRPRTENFNRALKAEVRDALWMLARQWQLGEFRGDDAGSPVFARLRMAATQLKKYQAGSPAETFEDNVPLEAKVERRPIPLTRGGGDVALDLRLVMGRHWLKLLKAAGFPASVSASYLAQYPIHLPDETNPADAPICAHREAWSAFASVAGRRMDGAKLYTHLLVAGSLASDAIPGLSAAQRAEIDALGEKFTAWFARVFYQPAGGDAWEPPRLEYRFACAAPDKDGEKVLAAEEYYQGRLDWYSLDVDPRPGAALGVTDPVPKDEQQTLLPKPLTFEGMPNTRWWAFEDRRTNFGDVKPDTTDLAKLLLIEFGLVYANDWFVIPYTLPAGSIARIRGMAVTNVFGERTWIEAAGRGDDDQWQRWAMFQASVTGQNDQAPADTSLVLLPTVPIVQEGAPAERVLLIRDEVANMVWGVEKTVPLPSGTSKPGSEAALETFDYFRRHFTPAGLPPAFTADIRYQVMSSVPEEWIPFIPVHLPGDIRQTQLQRAALPRVPGEEPKPAKVRPRTSLLREGLDQGQPYFIFEEEVPRAGVCLTQSFQRTRWRDGRAWVWLGARKQTGRGEGSSGLTFDRIEDVKPGS